MKNYSLIFIVLLLFSCIVLGSSQSNLSQSEDNFEQFWHIFNKSYASFDEKGADWNATYKTYRPEVSAQTT